MCFSLRAHCPLHTLRACLPPSLRLSHGAQVFLYLPHIPDANDPERGQRTQTEGIVLSKASLTTSDQLQAPGTPGYWHFWPAAYTCGCPHYLLRFYNLLQRLTKFAKCIYIKIYIKDNLLLQTQIGSTQMKRHTGEVWEGPWQKRSLSPGCTSLQAHWCASQTWELAWASAVQGFYWGFIPQGWLIESLAMWLNSVSSLPPHSLSQRLERWACNSWFKASTL